MADTLPNATNALVDSNKLTDYLLSLEHPKGKDKAVFFMRFGFTSEQHAVLADSLKKHALTQPVIEAKTSEYGVKYILKCTCETPDSRNPCIKSVWIVEDGNVSPRLITAYP